MNDILGNRIPGKIYSGIMDQFYRAISNETRYETNIRVLNEIKAEVQTKIINDIYNEVYVKALGL